MISIFFSEPVIMNCGHLTVANASSERIHLDTSSLQVFNARNICVSSLNMSFGNKQCFGTWSDIVVLKHLTSATEYQLEINAVINSSDVLVSSSKSCPIVAATCKYSDEHLCLWTEMTYEI